MWDSPLAVAWEGVLELETETLSVKLWVDSWGPKLEHQRGVR